MSSNDQNLPPEEALRPAYVDTSAVPVPVVPPPGAVYQHPPPPVTFPLHPGFWWAVLWCLALLLFTQVPAGVVAIVLMLILVFLQPGQLNLNQLGADPAALYDSPAFQVVIGVALYLAHLLIIVFSLFVLRVVVGREWRREVALRLPSLTHVLLVLALTPAFIVLANASYQVVQKELGFPGFNDVPGTVCFLASLFTTLAMASVVCLILRLSLGEHWGRRLFRDWLAPAPLAVSLVAIAAFVFAAVRLYQVWLPGFERVLGPWVPPENASGMEKMAEMFNGWPLFLAVFVIGVMPGLSEELWCRAYLGRGLVGTHGYFWGVLLTSFLFGLIHMDPCQGTMAMVLGVVLHLVYLWGRSLLLPMLLHFLNNSLAVSLTRIPALKALETEDLDWLSMILLLNAAALLMVAVGLALYQSRARLVPVEAGPGWEPPYPGVALPPRGSNTRVDRSPLHPGLGALVLLALACFAAALAYALGWRF